MNAFKSLMLAAAAAIAIVGLSSCNDNVNTVENADKQAKPQFIDAKRIITDPLLENRLQIMNVETAINESGLLQVQVTARNTRTGFWAWLIHGDAPYRLAYKYTWLDANGMEVKTSGTGVYLERQVLPGDTTRFSGLAPTPMCKDFQLSIKEMDNP